MGCYQVAARIYHCAGSIGIPLSKLDNVPHRPCSGGISLWNTLLSLIPIWLCCCIKPCFLSIPLENGKHKLKEMHHHLCDCSDMHRNKLQLLAIKSFSSFNPPLVFNPWVMPFLAFLHPNNKCSSMYLPILLFTTFIIFSIVGLVFLWRSFSGHLSYKPLKLLPGVRPTVW